MPVFWRRHPTGVALGSSAFAATGVLIAVFGGNKWWTGEAGAYSRNIYKPLAATSTLAGDLLTLRLANTVVGEPSRGRFVNFLGERKVDDFLPGHCHLVHL